jgi:WhiB family redox-sensing transcriptional regulator
MSTATFTGWAWRRTADGGWASDAEALARVMTSDYGSGNWRDEGLCAQTDPDAFFPDKGGSVKPAKKVCAACPVQALCLEYALAHDERYGIWGGLSERERRALKKKNATTGTEG